ncbi:hypothetical protein F4776DRAFT_644770 [Hypoxylon sp. NC0597]|nr:hypothetical protein F4776DRAFT_644770 [Hypoxylon sp. NC0597]
MFFNQQNSARMIPKFISGPNPSYMFFQNPWTSTSERLWTILVDYLADFIAIWTCIVVLVLAYRLVKNIVNVTFYLVNVYGAHFRVAQIVSCAFWFPRLFLLAAFIYLTIRAFPSLARQ